MHLVSIYLSNKLFSCNHMNDNKIINTTATFVAFNLQLLFAFVLACNLYFNISTCLEPNSPWRYIHLSKRWKLFTKAWKIIGYALKYSETRKVLVRFTRVIIISDRNSSETWLRACLSSQVRCLRQPGVSCNCKARIWSLH